MKKTEWFAVLIIALLLVFMLTGYNNVAGGGKDIQGSAEWVKEKIAQPTKQEPAK